MGTLEGLDARARSDIGQRVHRLRQGLDMAFRSTDAELELGALLERLKVIRGDADRLERIVAAHVAEPAAEDATRS